MFRRPVVLLSRSLLRSCSKPTTSREAVCLSAVASQHPRIASRIVQPCACISTSTPRPAVPPLIWMFLKPVLQLTSALSGRRFRKWWFTLPDKRRRHYYEQFIKHKHKITVAVWAVILLVVVPYILTHVDRTPVTKRKRFIAITKAQFEKIVDFEVEQLKNLLGSKYLSENDLRFRLVQRVVANLVNANRDIEEVLHTPWRVHLLQSEERNAFVTPKGDIFVFTGFMQTVENESQLAIILAHEMSHAILSHTAENLSRAQLIDYVVILFMAALWAIIPSDGIALVYNWFMHKTVQLVLTLPYSRKLETEADEVGLIIAAKACYDVRESYVYWSNLALMDKVEQKSQIPDLLSTHPGHGERAERLDNLVPKAERIRYEKMCPALPSPDPRRIADAKKHLIEGKLAEAGKL